MAYPFAGFGSFLFQRSEWPLPGTDTRWKRDPSRDQSRPIGSARDSIVTIAIGSAVRSFECLLSQSRFSALEALINTTATFTDWDRPLPNTRSAFLSNVQSVETVAVSCIDDVNKSQMRIRAKVELISQL